MPSTTVMALISRNSKTVRNGFSPVSNLAVLADQGVQDVSASVWNIGDTIDLSTISEDCIMMQTFKSRSGNAADDTHAYVMVVDVELNGNPVGAKNLYFSSLTKSVSEWEQAGTEFRPKGTAVNAGNAFYTQMLGCSTLKEQYDALVAAGQQGKKLVVTNVLKVSTARYREGNPVGLRNAQIPVFELR